MLAILLAMVRVSDGGLLGVRVVDDLDTAHILQLLDDAELRASKGAGGRGYVQAHHAPAVLLEALRRAAEAAQAGGSGTSATSGAG